MKKLKLESLKSDKFKKIENLKVIVGGLKNACGANVYKDTEIGANGGADTIFCDGSSSNIIGE